MQRRGEIGTGFIPAADRVRRYRKTDGERVTQLLPSASHSTHPGVTVSQPATTRLLPLPAGCPRGNKLPGKDTQHTESTTHARGHRPPKLQRVKALTHGATALHVSGPQQLQEGARNTTRPSPRPIPTTWQRPGPLPPPLWISRRRRRAPAKRRRLETALRGRDAARAGRAEPSRGQPGRRAAEGGQLVGRCCLPALGAEQR